MYVVVCPQAARLFAPPSTAFWDPAGFTVDGSADKNARRRQTEPKHARVKTLTTMGCITPEITGQRPGYPSPPVGLNVADIPIGLGVISKVPAAGWRQSAARYACCELSQDQSACIAATAGGFGWKVLTSG